ncbi:MAG: Trk system potassium transporter TrkA [Arenicella sp.]
MKIIILGASQVGCSMAEVLVGEGNDITLVDLNATLLKQMQHRLDMRTVVGHAAHPSVLENAGAEDADLLLAVTDSDEINMAACQIADIQFNTPTKIARIRSQDYLDNPSLFDKNAGMKIDVVISPEQILTNHISRLIEYPGSRQVLDFADGLVQLVGMKVFADGPMVGQRIGNLAQLMEAEARIAAIYRGAEVITPKSSTVFQADDEIFFVAARKNILKIMGMMRNMDIKVRRVILAGGGNIGLNLAKNLERKGLSVKIVEKDLQRAQKISDSLRDTVVLNGDASDIELLQQENISGTDVFCAITQSDETNILSAMVAKQIGAKRVMALVNRDVYLDKLKHKDVNVVISPKVATTGSILAHIRRGDVVAVHSLRLGRAEAIEAIAHGDAESSKVVGVNVRDLPLPPGTGIGAIVRGEDVIMPKKDVVIEPEDHVILFMVDKKYIHDVEQLFQVDVTFL